MLKDDNYVQQLMNSILSAMNSIGILERNYTSNRLQLKVNNLQISLDRLDEAHEALLTETKLLIDLITQTLTQHLQTQSVADLEHTSAQIREVAGAMQFLNAESGQQALKVSADFVHAQVEAGQNLTLEQVNHILDTLASADMLIDNLKN